MSTHTSVPEPRPVIHLSSVDLAESACVAATFLDGLGVVARTLHVTELGRVECMVDGAGFDRAGTRLVVDFGGTRHMETEPDSGTDFLFVEGRVDGVPVQVWTSREERDGHEAAQVEASNARENTWFAGPIGGASL